MILDSFSLAISSNLVNDRQRSIIIIQECLDLYTMMTSLCYRVIILLSLFSLRSRPHKSNGNRLWPLFSPRPHFIPILRVKHQNIGHHITAPYQMCGGKNITVVSANTQCTFLTLFRLVVVSWWWPYCVMKWDEFLS